MSLTFPERRRLFHARPTHELPAVAQWVASVPPGTTGTAQQLLPAYLATSPDSMPLTAIALGLALTRLLGCGVSRTLRSGTSTWTLTPSSTSAPLAMPSA